MGDFDRYELFEPLGEDPYGVVVRARDHQAERWVAILQMHSRFQANAEMWEEIWSGVVRRANLRHEYVTAVHDLLKPRGWVVCELMKGNMEQFSEQGPVDPAIVRTALRRSLEALKWLHSNHEWHGAIRPENLQYDREGAVKLAFSPGFKLGGQIPHQGRNGKYLAPELLKPDFGAEGPGVDLYGLGMTALELLIGAKMDALVKGASAEALDPNLAWLRWHTNKDVHLPPTKELMPEAPSDVAEVIDRLIRKPVAERYDSAEEALAHLDSQRPEKPVPVAAAAEMVEATIVSEPPRRAAPRPVVAPVRASSPKPASKNPRSWAQRKLDNPYILTAVIATIVGITIVAIMAKFAPPTAKTLAVVTEPPGATIYIDGKKYAEPSNVDLNLLVGKRKIRVEKAGFKPVGKDEQEIDLTAKDAPTKLEFKLMAEGKAGADKVAPEITVKVPPEPGPAKPPGDANPVSTPPAVKPAVLVLPADVAAIGKETDRDLGLPVKIRASKLGEGEDALELVLIPAGPFVYGASEPLQPGELLQRSGEIAAPYYIATTETSRGQWDAFVKAAGKDQADGLAPASGEGSPDLPMTGVSYDHAKAFCQWLSPAGRLPTEQEWERAARGIDGRTYPWGSGAPNEELCNISKGIEQARALAPCRSFAAGATPSGILNLLGNAAEWCEDIYLPGFDDEGIAGKGVDHAIRGASVVERSADRCRSTWRANLRVEGAADVGFRVVVPVK